MQEDKKKEESMRRRDPIGFKFAYRGLVHFFRTQRNARIHLVTAVLVVIAGLVLGLSQTEWLLVVLCIGVVMAAELFNTAIEVLTDLAAPGYNKKAGILKDMAAGAVLLTALAVAIIGLVIFIPKILEAISTWSVP